MALTRADYADQLDALSPPGQALPRDPDSLWQRLLVARAGAFSRLDGRADALLEEADPRTASELLPDWERVTALPDSCVSGEQTADDRRASVIGILAGTGGASAAYFIDLAASMGIDITIEEYTAHSVAAPVSAPIYGIEWRWAWTVIGPESQQLRCAIQRYQPAHTVVLFDTGEE